MLVFGGVSYDNLRRIRKIPDKICVPLQSVSWIPFWKRPKRKVSENDTSKKNMGPNRLSVRTEMSIKMPPQRQRIRSVDPTRNLMDKNVQHKTTNNIFKKLNLSPKSIVLNKVAMKSSSSISNQMESNQKIPCIFLPTPPTPQESSK